MEKGNPVLKQYFDKITELKRKIYSIMESLYNGMYICDCI
jgi:hypothetical protein